MPPSLCSSSLITLSSFAPCCHLARYASPSSHLSHSSTPRSPQNSPSPLLHLHVLVAPSLRARGKKTTTEKQTICWQINPLFLCLSASPLFPCVVVVCRVSRLAGRGAVTRCLCQRKRAREKISGDRSCLCSFTSSCPFCRQALFLCFSLPPLIHSKANFFPVLCLRIKVLFWQSTVKQIQILSPPLSRA